MNPRRLLFVVLALALLALAVHFLSRAGDHGEVAIPAPAARPLLSGAPEGLRALSIFAQPNGRFVKLERLRPGEWMVSEPFEDRAEPIVVQNSLATLFGDDWQPAPPEWTGRSDADLGLAPPEWVVEARFEDGGLEELRIGATDLTSDWYAATRNGERIRLGARSVRLLGRPEPEWRDKRVVAQQANLQRIEWRPAPGSGDGFVLQRIENRWHLYQPFSAPLSPLARDSVARMLGARTEILPEARISAEQSEQMRAGGTLRLHGPAGEQVVYLSGNAAWNDSRPFLLAINPDDFQVLSLAPEDLRSPLLLDLDRDEIVSLRLRRGDEEMIFRRDGDGWNGPNGIYVGEGDLRRGVPQDPMHRALGELVLRLCTVENRVREPLPEGRPSGEVLLSRSSPPVERGGQTVLWWPGEDGRSQLALPGARECVPLDGEDLDRLWVRLAQRFQP